MTHLVLEPLELLRRLAALVPAPGLQMVRYHGVLANRCKLRARLPKPPPRLLPQGVEPPASQATPESVGAHPARGRCRLRWAQLLYRVLFLDALLCGKCGGRMKVMAFLSDPMLVRRILDHLKIPATPPPIWPARTCAPDPLWPPHEQEAPNHGWTDTATGNDTGRAPP